MKAKTALPVCAGIIALGFAFSTDALGQKMDLHYADSKVHPYADPAGGREGHRHTGAKVNELRLYDFYSRQADYYITHGNVPEIIPAFPGMDAGINSHWGTHPQVHYLDDAWSRMDNGPAVGSVMAQGENFIVKGIHLRLEGETPLFATFDPLTLSYRQVWSGKFLAYPDRRWGITGLVEPAGEIILKSESALSAWTAIDAEGNPAVEENVYQGYYRHGNDTVFKYKIQSTEILDRPGTVAIDGIPIFTRTLKIANGSPALELRLFQNYREATRQDDSPPNGFAGANYKTDAGILGVLVRSTDGATGIRVLENELGEPYIHLPPQKNGAHLTLYSWHADLSPEDVVSAIRGDHPALRPELLQGSPPLSPQTVTVSGERGSGDGPYVIDTIPVPFENPHRSPMFLTGLDFFPNGDAAVSTFFGDVWIVRGLNSDLKSVQWKRIARGLNQPLGLLIIDGKIHTLGKDQITVLHDLNGDEEIDFYENFCNAYTTSAGSHDYNTGFQQDASGHLYFATKHIGVVKVSPDGREIKSLGSGLRNPNGIGVSPDGRVWTSPQEGQWTPAMQIVRIQNEGFYGFENHLHKRTITPGTAYVPRGVDNSTGGSVYITSDHWGPLKDRLVVFSYGAASHYLYLEDESGPSPQGAVVPLKGDFLSGVHRARVNPADGQVYAIGTQGWMNYAIQDGSFERIRYTGKPVYYPIGFQVFQNGIRVDFGHPLLEKEVEDPERYFAQQWQYLYSTGYGSPEFSIRKANTVGHDPLRITSVNTTNEGYSLFLEIPELIPAMTVHLRLPLRFEDGNSFATDLFATIHQLGEPFSGLANPEPIVAGKPQTISLPIRESSPPREEEPDHSEPGRPILLQAITGLKYDQEKITVQAGERISLTLANRDEMPHNWVLTGFFTYELVGQLADAMVSDPTAAERHYVPDEQSILQSTRLLNPGESQTIHFNAPEAPGKYPFLCTFPGHWQIMKGMLVVY